MPITADNRRRAKGEQPARQVAGQQNIHRTTLRSILCGEDRLVIPMFQRTYCWSHPQVDRWWTDLLHVSQGVSSSCATDQGLSFHNINTIRLKRLPARSTAIVVDGQQRLTTTSLLLAAAWHAGRRLAAAHSDWPNALAAIDQSLFVGGSEQKLLRLVPSLSDREAYQLAIFTEELSTLSKECLEQPILIVRRLFDAHLREQSHREGAGAAALVCQLVRASLDLMRPMLVELDPTASLPDLFQHYQEQSLLGVASLLRGIPGRNFQASDLVRNLMMADFVELELSCQEDIYRRLWLEAVEGQAAKKGGVDTALNDYLSTIGFSAEEDVNEDRFVSDFEAAVKRVLRMRLAMARDDFEDETEEEDDEKNYPNVYSGTDEAKRVAENLRGIALYARFYSRLEQLKLEIPRERHETPVQIFLEDFKSFLKSS